MATNTKYDPFNINQFSKDKLEKNAEGVFGTATAGTSTSIDLLLTDDSVIAGGSIMLVKDASWGDTAHFQIIHPQYGMIKQFITSWPINPDKTDQVVPGAQFPAKLIAGLTLRVVYNSVGTTNVKVAIGYNKEKVLE